MEATEKHYVNHVDRTHNGLIVGTRTNLNEGNQFAFSLVPEDATEGTPLEDVETPVVYTGEMIRGDYIAEESLEDVPQTVIDAVSRGATVVKNVDGGWESWDGRPEFSEAYCDCSDAEIVEGSA
ncbi:hypothetical protein [Halomontanus rarus]|uniref:hypothetical protein n=1 Tax=Halomontanus rarus TaxID=3034020 RepID=UPI00307B9A51